MNPDKCHVMVFGAKTLPEDFIILVDDTALFVEDQVRYWVLHLIID